MTITFRHNQHAEFYHVLLNDVRIGFLTEDPEDGWIFASFGNHNIGASELRAIADKLAELNK